MYDAFKDRFKERHSVGLRKREACLDEHLLLLKLLGDVVGGGATDLNPGLTEERARTQHEHYVEQSVQRVRRHLHDTLAA